MTVRVGVIGTGFGARVVAPVFAATDGCAVLDVVSARDASAVRALCARDDVDVISVHSPPMLHRAHVDAAIDAGHAVLCDKPFGLNAGDAAHMAQRAEDAGVVGLVNFEFRHDPMRQYLKDTLESGALGVVDAVVWTHVSSGSRVPMRPYGWLFDRASGGGWLGAWGSHALDALRWWFGPLFVDAAQLTTTIASRPDRDGSPHACDADDTLRVWLRTEAGAWVAITSTFAAEESEVPRLVIGASEAVAEVVGNRRVEIRRSDGTNIEWRAPEGDRSADPHLAPMRAWTVAVRDAVRTGVVAPGMPTFTDGLAVAHTIDAIRAASAARPSSGGHGGEESLPPDGVDPAVVE